MSHALDHIQEMIERVGWAVPSYICEKYKAPLTYTVGLVQTYKHPELVIAGMGMRQAHTLLTIAVECIKNGKSFHDGLLSNDIITQRDGSPLSVEFHNVNDNDKVEHLCQAYYHNDMQNFDALQMFWPDTQGKFPYQKGFEEKFNFQFMLTEHAKLKN